MTGTLLLASLVSFSTSGVGQAAEPAPRPPLLDVPYLSQSEALCGGAAAAMVLRYWGAPGVAAEDFASLVERGKGGIETSALAGAVQARGYQALPASGTPPVVQRELADARPVIALIEDRPGAFHYVVIVGWHSRAVVLHDPARTPYVLMNPEDFERRWKASRNWMLVIVPGSESQFRVPVQSPDSEPVLRTGTPNRCDALVVDGVRSARENDLGRAERLLTDAAYQCEGAAPVRELAGVRLLQRRWPEVRDLAGRATEIDPTDAHAWRLLATARYIGGDHGGALDAWNHAGEPHVDLVSVSGLQRTTHRVVEQLIGIKPGTVLTKQESSRASRRLAELPAALTTRFEYVPRGSGLAEVRAHVVERNVIPRGILTWAAVGLRAAASREVGVAVAALGHGGERLDAIWRFWPGRPGAGVALHVPGSFGVLSLELVAERQPFDMAALADAERLAARGRIADWATGALRWETRAGFARWRQSGRFATIGGSGRLEIGEVRLEAAVDGWIGDGSFATGVLRGDWRSSPQRRGLVLDVSAGVETIGARAPLDLWPAGDTGHARQWLLRAHPVLDEGRLRVARLGRHIVQSTTELQYWWRRATVPVAAAMFVDAARVGGRPTAISDPSALTDVDAGVGFRLALPGRGGTFRADFAHGLRDGRNVVSLSWRPE